jgi:hypothetical protein
MVFDALETREENRDAERSVNCNAAACSTIQCILNSIAAAGAHFSGRTFMSRLVERKLVIGTPRENHEGKREAEDTVNGEQPFGFRDPSLTRAFQFNSSWIL